MQRLDDPQCSEIRGTSGLYFTSEPLGPGGKLAFLFPGEGAQYLGMLGDVRRAFPEVKTFFAECDAMCRQAGDVGPSLTDVFLPPDNAGPDELAHAEQELRQIDHAMLSVMMADWASIWCSSGWDCRPTSSLGTAWESWSRSGPLAAWKGAKVSCSR